MSLLTHEDLSVLYNPSYIAEDSNIHLSEEEALYEDLLVESANHPEIDALSNYLAENFSTEELDSIFTIVESLQDYLSEFFRFENENEINEAILSLDEESIFEILEDIEYSEGITEDTYLDITETVQSIFESSEIIEEAIISEAGLNPYSIDRKQKKSPLSDFGKQRKALKRLSRREERHAKNLAAHKKLAAQGPHAYRMGSKNLRPIAGKEYSDFKESYELTQEEYDYLMEQAAILSTLKVATVLSEAGFLDLAKDQLKKGYKRHVGAVKELQRGSDTRRGIQRKFVKAVTPLADKFRKDKESKNVKPGMRQKLKDLEKAPLANTPKAGEDTASMLAYRGKKGQSYGRSVAGKPLSGGALTVQQRTGKKQYAQNFPQWASDQNSKK